MNTEHQQPDDESLEAPAALVAALKNTPSTKMTVPSAVDEAILRQAREQLEDRRKVAPLFPRPQWLAAAAAIAVLGIIFFTRPGTTPVTKFAREDINEDGQVDILDAYALSLKMDNGQTTPSQDLNGDGAVDGKDSDHIAERAVQLNGGHRS